MDDDEQPKEIYIYRWNGGGIDAVTTRPNSATHPHHDEFVKFTPEASNRREVMSDWVNVNDRLPPDREFLVCDKFGRRFVAELSGGSDKHFTEIYRGERLSGITHWMPLPRPPKLD